MLNRRVKSNRAQADYFELLVAQYICHLYSITFSYSKNLAELSNQILNLPHGKERLKLQNDNLLRLGPKLKQILDYEVSRKGQIIKVIWTGRRLIIQTTSDVDAEHITHKFTRFSIKSVFKSGFGTIKNLGMRTIKNFLSVDFKNEYEEMWQRVRNYLKKPSETKSSLKKLMLSNNKLLDWATENGKQYQRKLNDLCFKAFNELDINRKVEFINFILDAYDDDLYVIIVNSKGVIVYKPKEKMVTHKQTIEAVKDSDVGYTIFINKIPAYKIQTNATNGIGISPFCQRVFFAEAPIDNEHE